MKLDSIIFFLKEKGNKTKGFYFVVFTILKFVLDSLKEVKRRLKNLFFFLYLKMEKRDFENKSENLLLISNFDNDYHKAIQLNMKSAYDLNVIYRELNSFRYNPIISVLLVVDKPDIEAFKMTIESLIKQSYSYWNLCISVNLNQDKTLVEYISEFSKNDSRISVLSNDKVQSVSANLNKCLAVANGDYITVLGQEDMLNSHALYEAVKQLNLNNSIDFIYSDEDKITLDGERDFPIFKPDFSLDSFLSHNYIGNLSVIKRDVVNKVLGFREEFEGSHQYDLYLRVIKEIDQNNIFHIPKVLYHLREGRSISQENPEYSTLALTEYVNSIGEPGKVDVIDDGTSESYYVNYTLKNDFKVSIIIPTKDQTQVLKTCVDSVFEKTTYNNFEVVLLDNNSSSPEFFEYVKECEKSYGDKFKYVEASFPFNFSKLMNVGVEEASGEFILLLNNDVEVINPEWMTSMVRFTQRESVGCVGAKLIFPNDSIQHAGVTMGLGGIAGHSFVGKAMDENGYMNYLKRITNYSAVTAACLMVRREVYNAVGGFNEFLEVEFNDVDFCLKVKDKGFNNVYLPDVELYHYESLSRGRPTKGKEGKQRNSRETEYIQETWKKYILDDPCYNPNLSLNYSDFRVNI